ncbi:MAG: FAD-dependent monooxygenase [Wenzhouxiangella sp.]
MNRFDVIVAGGGLAGSALALALAGAGRRVAVVEAAPRRHSGRPSFDDRTLVVNAASLNILANLGVLDRDPTRCPLERIEITRAGAPGHLVLDAKDYGCERFGAVIVARELGEAMLETVAESDRVTEYCPNRIESFETGREGVTARLDDGSELTAALLVGADGTRSKVREHAGLASESHDYGQAAMIFNVKPEHPRAGVAFERFTDRGPLALLPQPEGRVGVVWIDRADAIETARELPDAELACRLERHFGSALGRFSSPGRRAAYPLILQRTPHPVGRRVVVLGNAANTIHPVSAQGFNLGLRDVAGLADALEGREDPGDPAVLAGYAAARRGDQAATVRYTDTLARAFTNPSLAVRAGSSLGLAAHAAIPALSRRLVRSAMGFREPVSRLARERAS